MKKMFFMFLCLPLLFSSCLLFNSPVFLDNISITTEPNKTTYLIGDTFDPTGMKVTAKYTDDSTKDVTDKVTISGFDSSEKNLSQMIIVIYEEGDEKSSDFFFISINEPPTKIDYKITYSKAKTWTDSINSSWVQIMVEFENTGDVPIYLSSGGYDLEYEDGTVIASHSLTSEYPGVLQVGEKGYFYDATILDTAPTEDLIIVPRIAAKVATVNCIRFDVTQVNITDTQYFGPKVTGKIKNNTTKDCDSTIYVVVVFFNGDKEPIGVVKDIIYEDLPAGGSMGFEASTIYNPYTLTADDIKSYKTFAYPNQYQFD